MYWASDVCITSKLWLTRSSSEAGPTLAITCEPLADLGAPSASGAAAGCCICGAAFSSQGLPPGRLSGSSRPCGSSSPRFQKGSRELREAISRSTRLLIAGGRSITGN
ncbi:hypothetical protein FQZ97_1179360 [compost metagenome]